MVEYIEIKPPSRRRPTIKSIRKELAEQRRKHKRNVKEKRILKIVKRKRSISGRINRALSSGLTGAQKGITRSLHERDLRRSPEYKLNRKTTITRSGGIKTGKKGRPKGSYDIRYAKWGGVINYRKWVAQQNKIRRLQSSQQERLNPRQQVALSRIEQNRIYREQAMERQTFPDTTGNINLGNIMEQINSACNLVD